MANINDNYLKLPGSYLFAEIAHRITNYRKAHADADIIRLGIGDVTRPLPMVSIRAMHAAVDEMADAATFRGYGP
ncbi:MAG: LL-diaminopimelate aminotransferase, partial [Selenomonadaceae bacterium]|nr:LL-diaminopimelate aminotransferase [Selenomonadaceae bacterium]